MVFVSDDEIKRWLELVFVRLQGPLSGAREATPDGFRASEAAEQQVRREMDSLGLQSSKLARVFANALVDEGRMRELGVSEAVASEMLSLRRCAIDLPADPAFVIAGALMQCLFAGPSDIGADVVGDGDSSAVPTPEAEIPAMKLVRKELCRILGQYPVESRAKPVRDDLIDLLLKLFLIEREPACGKPASELGGIETVRIANKSAMEVGSVSGSAGATVRSIVIPVEIAGNARSGPGAMVDETPLPPVAIAGDAENGPGLPLVKALESPRGVVAPPAANWTWLPPDPSLPAPRGGDWVSDTDGISHGEALADGRFLAAAVRGRGHKQDALYCDDSFSFLSTGEWRILVVSDGAGSAKLSRVGSERACAAVQRHFERALRDVSLAELELREADLGAIQSEPASDPRLLKVIEAFETGFAEANQAILQWIDARNVEETGERAERRYIDQQFRGSDREASRHAPDRPDDLLRILPGDCNCTLLVCAYTSVGLEKADGSKRRMGMVVSCAIGDGMIAVFRRLSAVGPRVMMLMAPDTGQFAGQTQFLSSSTASAESVRARVSVRFAGAHSDVLAVAAMSDGVADDYYEGQAGMERLYCDLVLNGLLPVAASAEAVSEERRSMGESLRARATDARVELARLDEQLKSTSVHVERFKIEQQQKALRPRLLQLEAESLVVEESVLCHLAEGELARKVPIKYAARYCDALALAPRQMLDRPALLSAIALCAPRTCAEPASLEDPSSSARAAAGRIRDWLDSYIVRGSFDDRTLALLEMVETP
jgi:hypothetical protein